MKDHSQSLQTFLQSAVDAKVAPGLVAVAFTNDSAFATASAGVSNVETQAPMTKDSVVWLASMSKSACSVVALILVEQHKFDIDSHEDLAAIVPELAKTPGNPLWTLFDGKDADGKWKFKDATVGITLRHLLTHTAGTFYDFNSEEGKWVSDPEGGGYDSLFTAKISALVTPRMFESGTRYQYGASTDFVGLFITRISKMNTRKAFQDLLFTPLGINEDLDQFRSPSMDERRVQMALQVGEDTFVPFPAPFDTAQFSGDPPEGLVPLISGVLHGTVPQFAIFARALLNRTAPSPNGKPLLSPEMWKLATADQLPAMSIPPNKPFAQSHNAHLMSDIEFWSQAANEKSENLVGWNLLQTISVLEPTASGLSAGSFNWSGLANSYYFMDEKSGLGGVISAQFFPWAPKQMLKLRDDFERWVVDIVAAEK